MGFEDEVEQIYAAAFTVEERQVQDGVIGWRLVDS